MRILAALVLTFISGCTAGPRLPQYMKEAERGEEGTRRALELIRGELGPEFETRVVDDVFFLASNGGTTAVEAAEETIRRMTGHLYATYFSRRPTRPIRIYCFRNPDSYAEYVRSAYGRSPTTPYGFYMASERKMALNLGTGLGTLQHELVHPLIGEDFPGVPAWFNEGFASLFEHAARKEDGQLQGLVNWRLWDLKRAFQERREVRLATLMETNTDEFYGDERGVHYATARYFCIYLQRQNLLVRYYQEFRATVNADPTGKAALERVTRKSLADFEKEWRTWVTDLR
ncbi:MAG TPA: hypothetical protein VK661_08755 [Planctomycetota bacterium]|nr:hypothetical protein [Planctomycetota bacterium]